VGLPRSSSPRWVAAAIACLCVEVGASAKIEDAVSENSTAAALLDRAFHNLYADDYIQTMELTTRSRGGREMSKRLQITRKQSVRPGKALVRFIEPYAIRRTSVLVLENDERADDLYVYLPAVERTRHLSAAQRKDSFFGTDLSYEDVEPKQASDYVADWASPAGADDEPCVVMEISARPQFESTYERLVSCIERERAIILWTEFYRDGSVVKRLEIDPREVRQIGTKFIPFAMTITATRKQSETRIVTESYELRPSIPDNLLSTWNLEWGNAARDRSKTASSD
jgi:hypothetical protein